MATTTVIMATTKEKKAPNPNIVENVGAAAVEIATLADPKEPLDPKQIVATGPVDIRDWGFPGFLTNVEFKVLVSGDISREERPSTMHSLSSRRAFMDSSSACSTTPVSPS
jgi:hypothetical protein